MWRLVKNFINEWNVKGIWNEKILIKSEGNSCFNLLKLTKYCFTIAAESKKNCRQTQAHRWSERELTYHSSRDFRIANTSTMRFPKDAITLKMRKNDKKSTNTMG